MRRINDFIPDEIVRLCDALAKNCNSDQALLELPDEKALEQIAKEAIQDTLDNGELELTCPNYDTKFVTNRMILSALAAEQRL